MESRAPEEKTKDTLLEQYKLYVQLADNVSARRGQTNGFFVSILSGVLALLFIASGRALSGLQNVVLLSGAILGLILCFLWFVNIRSYRQLNSAKFKVIHEMEKHLPYPCYDKEWAFLEEGKRGKKYLQLSQIEQYVPFALTTPYLLLLAYSLFMWLTSE